MKLLGWIVAAIFIAGILVAGCFASIHNDDDHGSLGRVELISHRHRDCDYDDCEDRDGGKQTCFMACYITVPGLPGQDQPSPDERERVSLVPPTPDKIIGGIQVMGDAGIKLGSTIAQLVIDYVVTVFRFIV